MTTTTKPYFDKDRKSFVIGFEPSEPNPCQICGCSMGVLTICPQDHIIDKKIRSLLEEK